MASAEEGGKEGGHWGTGQHEKPLNKGGSTRGDRAWRRDGASRRGGDEGSGKGRIDPKGDNGRGDPHGRGCPPKRKMRT